MKGFKGSLLSVVSLRVGEDEDEVLPHLLSP